MVARARSGGEVRPEMRTLTQTLELVLVRASFSLIQEGTVNVKPKLKTMREMEEPHDE